MLWFRESVLQKAILFLEMILVFYNFYVHKKQEGGVKGGKNARYYSLDINYY